MSEPLNDAEFDEYLERRSALSRSYQDLHEEGPDARVSKAVLARALAQTNQARWRRYTKISVPVALAASVVLAVAALLENSTTHEFKSRVAAPAEQFVTVDVSPRPEYVPPPDLAIEAPFEAPIEVRDAAPSPVAAAQPQAPAKDLKAEIETDQLKKSASAPVPAAPLLPDLAVEAPIETRTAAIQSVSASPPPSAPPAPSAATAETLAERSEARAAYRSLNQVVVTEPKAIGRITAAQAVTAIAKSAEQWIKEIEALREQGKTEEAEERSQEFLKLFPQYQLHIEIPQPPDPQLPLKKK